MPTVRWLLVKFLGGDVSERITELSALRIDFFEGISGIWPWLLGLAFLGISLLGLFPRSPARWRVRVSLFVLRFLGFGLLMLLVVQTVARLDLQVALKPQIAVALDNSYSMQIRDVNGEPRSAAVAEALKGEWHRKLAARARVSHYSFAGSLSGLSSQTVATGEIGVSASQTDIGAALTSLAGSTTDLDAVVLFSDGNDLGGSRPDALGSRLRRRALPVFAVGVGSSVKPREIRIRQVKADEFVYLNDEITISATVASEGYDGQVKDVLLYEDAVLVQKQEVTLSARPQEVVFHHAPKLPGEHVYQVRIELGEEGLGTGSNLRELRVRVIDQKIRVLYVEGTARYEFKLLRQTIAEDPVIEYTSLLRVTSGYYAQGAPFVKNPSAGFPRSEDELLAYDVVILGSLSRTALAIEGEQGDSRLSNLANFVVSRGGGLILLGGPESYGPGGFVGSPIEPLLPVRLSVSHKQYDERFPLRVTPVGLLHPIMRIASTPKAVAHAWESVPQLDGCNALGSAKPTAVVLATTPGEGKRILMAVQQAGAGKVLAIATDSTWRWQMSRVTDENYYRRFWANAIRYLAPSPFERHGALNVTAHRSRYFVGDEAWVATRVVDEYYRPVPDAKIRFTVTGPRGARTIVDAKAGTTMNGRYDCRFALEHEGPYRVSVADLEAKDEEAESGKEKSSAPTYTIVAERPADEMEGTSVDEGYLRTLAEASGGAYVTLDTLDALGSKMQLRSKSAEKHVDLELRNSLPFAILIAALLCLEWAIRKRQGLV